MAYHEELLAHAEDLLHRIQPNAAQAHFRRAVSAAYYALFHLLISGTTLNWSRDSSKPSFGRMFDHGLMRKASLRILDLKLFPFEGQDPQVVTQLRSVAAAFVRLQNERHLADYQNGVPWTQSESFREVTTAQSAFLAWAAIRDEHIAQEYLVSFLIKPRD